MAAFFYVIPACLPQARRRRESWFSLSSPLLILVLSEVEASPTTKLKAANRSFFCIVSSPRKRGSRPEFSIVFICMIINGPVDWTAFIRWQDEKPLACHLSSPRTRGSSLKSLIMFKMYDNKKSCHLDNFLFVGR